MANTQFIFSQGVYDVRQLLAYLAMMFPIAALIQPACIIGLLGCTNAVYGQLAETQSVEPGPVFGAPAIAMDSPPQLIIDPARNHIYGREHRTCTGVASMAITSKGRLWVAWYSGTTPDAKIETCPNAHVVVSTSGDGGRTWKEVLIIDPDGSGPLKAVDPRPWVDPSGQLWIIWHVTINGVSFKHQFKKVWAITADDAEREMPVWSSPRFIANGVMLNKPIVLRDGHWLFANHDRKSEETGLIKSVVSEDRGSTFKVRGKIEVSHKLHAIEPMVVERKNGSLWMLIRTGDYPLAEHGVHQSMSTDHGRTWNALTLPNFKHTTSRFYIGRLQSGNLLLVKHSGVDVEPLTLGKKQRRELTAFISTDDGSTWSRGLVIDGRVGVTYPDAQQHSDGTIYLTWDYQRSSEQEILMTTFREEDVLEASDGAIARTLVNRRLVNKGGVK